MPEPDLFESRFRRAYSRYLDEVPVEVDGLEVARAAAAQRRFHLRLWPLVLVQGGARGGLASMALASAALIVLLLGSALIIGRLADPPADRLAPAALTSSSSPSPEPTGETAAGVILVDVTDLVGMEGLELVGKVWGPVSQQVPLVGPPPGIEFLHLPIDAEGFSASGQVTVRPGEYYMWVFAGEPPCDAGFVPKCAWTASDEPSLPPDYLCMVSYDVQPGEHIRIGLSGLPVNTLLPEEGAIAPCPVNSWVREP